MSIMTPRLELRPGSLEIFSTAPDDRENLARLLQVTVPPAWPVEHYDDDALTWCRRELEADPNCTPWLMRYVVLRSSNTLIGTAGCGLFDHHPSTAEIGYSILPEYRRKGYATEAVAGVLEWLFSHDQIERVIAHTYPDLVASIGVLEKSGFTFAGSGSEPGTIRYERLKC